MSDRDQIPNAMFKIEPLNNDNWIGWKQRVWSLLQDRELDQYVDSSKTRPDGDDPALLVSLQAWDKKDKQAQICIKLAVGDANMAHILGATTSKQMWDQLKAVRERRGNQGILAARRRLYWTQAKEGVDVAQHIAIFRIIQNELLVMGSTVTDVEFTVVLLASLPESWDQFTSALLGSQRDKKEDQLSSFEVSGILLEEYQRRQEHGNTESAFYSQGRNRSGKKPQHYKSSASEPNKVICDNCGKAGHMMRDCWQKGGGKEGQNPKFKRKFNNQKSNTSYQAEQEDRTFDFAYSATTLDAEVLLASTTRYDWVHQQKGKTRDVRL